ncbi:MAG TPA: aminotransferase class V-fold PLP-dependent enzyme [Pirellulales bacterium]|jgi:selenocysteine lyase/cysteine desulfurase|nr:aminotransferase class V-fold PLP-dependent enzyme [Pirellulales bacterium]
MTLSHDSRWLEFRRQMPIAGRWAYFDHAAVSPLPAPACEAVTHWLAEAAEQGGTAWPNWDRRLQQVRTHAAKMIGAEPEEIALLHNTTEGINLVAEGFPWQAGDNLVIPAEEFPTNQYAWMNLASRGVETRRVPMEDGVLDLNKLEAACDRRTRLIALSWVGFLSGWRTDLEAAADIAHRHAALLFVDAIQAFGGFPLDVRQANVDFFSAGGQKWMLGPEGVGLAYIRREHLPRLRPLGLGAHSVQHGNDYTRIELNLKDSAARYEGGGANSVGLIALGASLDLLDSLGLPAIGQRILEITDECCRRLQEIGADIISRRDKADHNSGIVTFELPGCDSLAVRRHSYARKVAIANRSGKLRISPHAYANEEDIDRLIEALREAQSLCTNAKNER